MRSKTPGANLDPANKNPCNAKIEHEATFYYGGADDISYSTSSKF